MFEIVTPGGAFPQEKDLIQKLTSIATYVDNPQWFQRLKNVQEYNNVPVEYPSCTGTTRVSSVHNLITKSLLFYFSLKCFYYETKYSKEDEELVKDFKYTTEE